MKKTGLDSFKSEIIWFLGLGVASLVFFVPVTKAESVYNTNLNFVTDVCYSGYGDTDSEPYDEGCDSGNQINSSAQYLVQELYITPSAYDPVITINKISAYIDSIPTGAGGNNPTYNVTGFILNQDQYDSWQSTGNLYGVATSSPHSSENLAAGQTVNFNFTTPLAVTSSSQAKYFVIKQDYQHIVQDTPEIRWRLDPSDSYPTHYSGFHSDYEFFYNRPSVSTTPKADLMISIWRNEATSTYPLTITNPENNSSTNEYPLRISGTCVNQLDLYVYQGSSLASTTQEFGSSLLCNSGEWISGSLPLTTGFWNVFASSTDSSAGIVFYYLAQSTQPSLITNDEVTDFLLSWSCEIPFLSWNPCHHLGVFVDNAKTTSLNAMTRGITFFKERKPYAYYFDIKDSLQGRFEEPTTTPSFLGDVSVDFAGENNVIFNASTTANIIPDTVWDTLRPYEDWLIRGSFLYYLIFFIVLT